MKFGPVPVAQAEGAILAHSLIVDGVRLRKGQVLRKSQISVLLKANIDEVIVAILDNNDMGEDQAAEILANALVPDQASSALQFSEPFTGRVNIYAETGGVVQIDVSAIHRFNAVSPDITVSTVQNMARVSARSLIATVKIIPYAVPKISVDAVATSEALCLFPFRKQSASLILTSTTGMSKKLLSKGREAVSARLKALNCSLDEVLTVEHDTNALAKAITNTSGNIILILTGSATSDINDVGPAALTQSGGTITRFGMPVDPGNLLFLGDFGGRPVVGLPGCARSPALNGADWVLERIACGITVTNTDIAEMGVGGLLKEIPTRPQPRSGVVGIPKRPKVEVLLLAAGASRRMRGKDKLLEDVGGVSLLRRSAQSTLRAQTDQVYVVVQPDNHARNAVLEGLDVALIESPDWNEGMAASIRAGMAALSDDCDAVVIVLADMPYVGGADIDLLVAVFDPMDQRDICRAVAADGTPGLPVLFGRRFFETLSNLKGDRGAKDVIKDASEFLVDVETTGQGAVIDLDTPEAWDEWRKNSKSPGQ